MKIYNENLDTIYRANTYDPLLIYLTGCILGHMDLSLGRNTLDLGCGTGRTSLALAKAGFHVTGIDQNIKALQIAEREAKNAGLSGTVRYVRGNITCLNTGVYHDFDYCILSEVIEHIPKYHKVISQGLNSLKKGGILIMTTPNSMNQWSVLDEYADHIRRFSVREIRDAMTGFRILKIYTVGFPLMRSLIYFYTRIIRIAGKEHKPGRYRNNRFISQLYLIIGTIFLTIDSLFNGTAWGTTIIAVCRKK